MVRKNILMGLCMGALLACSAETVPDKPVYSTPLLQPMPTVVSNEAEAKRFSKRFDKDSLVPISEITSLDDSLTAKSDSLYQNKHGDLVFTQNTILKFKCGNNRRASLIEVNGVNISIPVTLQNKDHVSTGCNKENGSIKYVKFLK